MMDYDPTIICDYITFWTADAAEHPETDLDNGRMVWDIPPQAYYFKDRGNVCMMSIVDATMPRVIADNNIIMTQSGFNGSVAQIYDGTNQFEDSIQDLAVLGNIVCNRGEGDPLTFSTTYQAPEAIRLLTPARPSKLKLYFVDEDKELHDFADASKDNGHFTVKFEYIKPEVLQKNIYSVEYKPAF